MSTTTTEEQPPPNPSSSFRTTTTLSEYEQQRARNIERNNARLRMLGLISTREEEISNAKAWGKQVKVLESSSEQSQGHTKDAKSINKKKRRTVATTTTSSSLSASPRKSRRLQGQQPDGGQIITSDSMKENDFTNDDDDDEDRLARVEECRLVRLQRALELSNQVNAAKKAAKENPTATYEHALMRVRTMTHKALINRIKTIERATGKHCVIKMAIFKCCLQDENLWELAELANQALERLKGLHPIPMEPES